MWSKSQEGRQGLLCIPSAAGHVPDRAGTAASRTRSPSCPCPPPAGTRGYPQGMSQLEDSYPPSMSCCPAGNDKLCQEMIQKLRLPESHRGQVVVMRSVEPPELGCPTVEQLRALSSALPLVCSTSQHQKDSETAPRDSLGSAELSIGCRQRDAAGGAAGEAMSFLQLPCP